MSNIFIIRHGESTANVDCTVYNKMPDWKIPLSERGKQQAKDTAPKLDEMIRENVPNIDVSSKGVSILHSPMERAMQTAQIIHKYSELTTGIGEDPLLSEQEGGNMDQKSMTQDEWESMCKEYGFFYYKPPNGESGLQAYMRARIFLNEYLDIFENENIVLVSHGYFIRLLLTALMKWGVRTMETMRHPQNCKILHVKREGFIWELKTPLENLK